MTKNSQAQITQALGNVFCINRTALVAIFYSESYNKGSWHHQLVSYCEFEESFGTSSWRITTIPLK